MSIRENSKLISYLPAQLHKGKEIYIDYYVLKPGTNTLFRKKIKLNRVRAKTTKTEFERYCRHLLKELNERLAYNWNPFLEQEAGKGYTLLAESLELFMKSKEREMTKNSIRSYKSFVKILTEYITNQLREANYYCINFNQQKAREFMSWCWNEKGISGKTFNGYVRAYHSIWAWFVEYGYSKVNAFDGITRKKEKSKKRAEISSETRRKIKNYLLNRNETAFWLMCELCYYCLIRPVEMCQIKVINVDLDKQLIKLEQGETKNQNERFSSVPKHMIPLLIEQLKSAEGIYLFSDCAGWKPGSRIIDSREISRRWSKLRKPLNIPVNIQFYSQRDSGIIYLLEKGINPEYVRAQADHYSLEMTTKYTNHYRPEGIEQIKNLDLFH